MSKEKIIAYYLPQYHATPDNDLWWGKGFTEWTNVAKARRLYPGHYQPHVPGELGFYNLLDPEVRESQTQLAKEAGVYGFCYYHYWFEYGKMELERPLEQVVDLGKPDFPFCLCWANESWYAKMWDKDSKAKSKKLLIEQKYKGTKDNELHFMYLEKTFRDSRYIKIGNRLLFVIYKPLLFVNFQSFAEEWNRMARRLGFDGFFFVGYTTNIRDEYDKIKGMGFDAVNDCRIAEPLFKSKKHSYHRRMVNKLMRTIFNIPNIISYKKCIGYFVDEIDRKSDVFPTLIPNWDHTPRSGANGFLFSHSTPSLFKRHVKSILSMVKDKDENNIIFLKSWNEWGEGNYMEPDLKFGRGYIEALKEVVLIKEEVQLHD